MFMARGSGSVTHGGTSVCLSRRKHTRIKYPTDVVSEDEAYVMVVDSPVRITPPVAIELYFGKYDLFDLDLLDNESSSINVDGDSEESSAEDDPNLSRPRKNTRLASAYHIIEFTSKAAKSNCGQHNRERHER
jgi:hypothetical protein